MWFEGPIEGAVNKAKNEKRLLIVFICGEDDNSKRVLEYWSDDGVKNLVTENSCVALKLADGSASAKQFAQIYPVISIPICFFITASGGVPLEVIVHFESLDDFKARLLKTIDSFGNYRAPTSPPDSSSDANSSNSVQAAAAVSKNSPADQAAESSTSPAGSSAAKNAAASSSEIQDRVQKAQALIKQRLEEKARDEKENARLAELKRRQEGQEMLKAQERVKEAEQLKNAYEQKKAKQEDKEHLKKLREQIAADRAEKAAKFSIKAQGEANKQDEKKAQKAEMDENQRLEEEEKRKRFSLLQFRLPDGSSIRNQFEGTALFGEAETWYATETNSALSSFILVQMYPRREFTADDRNRTLAELALTPNASLMVLPNVGTSSNGPVQGGRQNGGFISWIFSSIVYAVGTPIRYIYGLMHAFIFGPAPPRSVTSGPSTNIASNKPPAVTATDQKTYQRPVTAAATGTSSGGGGGGNSNVARLHNPQDTTNKDDDEATWNGNSTQQL